MSSQNIVIVGAGAAGLLTYNTLAAKAANSNINVILIEPRTFFVHQPSSLRMVVTSEGTPEDWSIISHPEGIRTGKNKRVIQGKVVTITDDDLKGRYVTLDSGEKIEYSVLVLATGSSWSGPLVFGDTKDEVANIVHSWRKNIKEAQDIVLVGGGAVGFELAGEIKDVYPEKRVTIVHTQELPLNNTYTDRWRKVIKRDFEKRGVNLIFGDAVNDFKPVDGKISTRNGKSIAADLVVPTFGSRPNTEFIKTLGPDALNEFGYVRVRPTLQLVNHPRIFAAGDVIEWKEEKSAIKSMAHAPLVAANILALVNNGGKLKHYKTGPEIILLTNGKNGGSSYLGILWGIVFGNWFTRLVKSKTLLIDKSKQAYGLDK